MREGDFKRDRKSNMAARYSADSREDVDFTDEGELAEVIRLIKKIYDILNRETFLVHKEKEAFNDIAKKLEHVHFAETLKLNIGATWPAVHYEPGDSDKRSRVNFARHVFRKI